MLSRFHLIPERYGQTERRMDRQTERFAISISRVSVLTRDKNETCIAINRDTMLIDERDHLVQNTGTPAR